MAKTVTVWVRLKDPTQEANRLQSSTPGALPLILRMRSSDSALEEDFIFPYSPREMNIGSLADEMVQIERPGTTPIIAFKTHKLMTLDFTALIAHPGDGLIRSVDSEIFTLRKFASSSNKVFQLLNYDIFTHSPYIFRNMSQEKLSGLFFSITDMSIDVTRRNKENSITSANVKMSLVENRNPYINIAFIPPLTFSRVIKKCKDPTYKAANPKKCGSSRTQSVKDLASQESNSTAAENQDKFASNTPRFCPDPKGTKTSDGKIKKIYIKPGAEGYCG